MANPSFLGTVARRLRNHEITESRNHETPKERKNERRKEGKKEKRLMDDGPTLSVLSFGVSFFRGFVIIAA
jgi:hypothetical protein